MSQRAAPGYARFGLVAVAAGVATILLVTVLSVPSALSPSTGHVATAGYWDIGDGLLSLSHDQNVTATPYWETYCGSSNPWDSCTIPVGVAYVPALNTMMLTEARNDIGGTVQGADAVVGFSPDTLRVFFSLPLGCLPGLPFYPGNGADVLVPCGNLTANPPSGALLVVDSRTGSLVADVPLTLGVISMAFDPLNGMVYLAGYPDTLTVFDLASDSVVRAMNVTGASFGQQSYGTRNLLVFDPTTDALILPSATGGLLAIDPTTGELRSVLPLPSDPLSLAVDPGSGRIFASAWDPSSVAVYNAKTYVLQANISIPDCVDNVCADPNDVQQTLFDPAHGDAYLLATSDLFTLNLSSLAVISTTFDYGDGPSASAAYAPVSDRIFGTYPPFEVGPGYMIQLAHGNPLMVSRLLWLPTGLGSLALAAVVGSTLALLHRRGARADTK